MPRNVVTLAPRLVVLPTPRNRSARRAVRAHLAERYRARFANDPARIELDFPKSVGRRAAKEQVAADLDRLEPRWRRLYVLYPTEDALRERGD